MNAEPANPATEDATEPSGAQQQALKDALLAAERGLSEAARSAEKMIREGILALRSSSGAEPRSAEEAVDEAQRYLVERVRERPVTAALAGLGVGLLLGLLLSSRGK